jgi:hypothetical protein
VHFRVHEVDAVEAEFVAEVDATPWMTHDRTELSNVRSDF